MVRAAQLASHPLSASIHIYLNTSKHSEIYMRISVAVAIAHICVFFCMAYAHHTCSAPPVFLYGARGGARCVCVWVVKAHLNLMCGDHHQHNWEADDTLSPTQRTKALTHPG